MIERKISLKNQKKTREKEKTERISFKFYFLQLKILFHSFILTSMQSVYCSSSSSDGLVLRSVPIPVPGPNEVLIEISAFALNRADILQRKGHYPLQPGANPILGLECSGWIVSINSSGPCEFQVGDAVMALLNGGGYAEFVAVDLGCVMKIPRGFSMIQSAGIPEVFITAFQLLIRIGDLQSSDRVLIHAGASGVGAAAIQFVKMVGAESFVTAGSNEKVEFCKEIGSAGGVNYKESDWGEKLRQLTGGESSINLILDPVGSSHLMNNFSLAAIDCRWVAYAAMGGNSFTTPNGSLTISDFMRKRIQYTGSLLRARSIDYKAKLVKNLVSDERIKFFESLESGKLKVFIEAEFPFTEEGIRSAHQLMEGNETKGKIVVNVRNSSRNSVTKNEEEKKSKI